MADYEALYRSLVAKVRLVVDQLDQAPSGWTTATCRKFIRETADRLRAALTEGEADA